MPAGSSRRAIGVRWAIALALALASTLAIAPVAAADCSAQLPARGMRVAASCPAFASFTYAPATSPTSPVATGTTVSFDGSASKGTGGITPSTWEWDWNGDGVYDTAPQSSATITHAFAARGAYDVVLRITDSGLATATTTKKVYVSNTQPGASFTVDRQAVSLHQAVSFDGSASGEAGASIVQYEWDWNGDGTYDATTTTPTTSHVFGTAGSYTPKLRVTDDIGLTATYTLPAPVVAVNQPPVAVLTISQNTIPAGGSVTLDGSASFDPDSAGPLTYAWDLDGDYGYRIAMGPAVMTHVFPTPGTFQIHLRVTDPDGASAVATQTLVVTAPPGGDPTTGGGGGPGGSAGGGSGGGGPGGGGAAASSFAASLGGSPIQRAKIVRKRGLVVTCAVTRTGTCSISAWISARDARRLGLRRRGTAPLLVATARAAVSAQRTVTLQLRPGARARGALARSRNVQVTVKGIASEAGSSRRATLSRAVFIRP